MYTELCQQHEVESSTTQGPSANIIHLEQDPARLWMR